MFLVNNWYIKDVLTQKLIKYLLSNIKHKYQIIKYFGALELSTFYFCKQLIPPPKKEEICSSGARNLAQIHPPQTSSNLL